jgi:hypothetical protein
MVVERKNRTIEESVKAMMNDHNLSMFLWGEAVMKVVYIQNRSPHKISSIFMFPRIRKRSWNLQKRKVYSLDIVNHQKHIEFMFQVSGRLKSAET